MADNKFKTLTQKIKKNMLLEDAQVDSVRTYDVPIIMSIPVVLSIRYYDKRLTIATTIVSVIAFAISCWYGCLHGQLNLCQCRQKDGFRTGQRIKKARTYCLRT